ncbi:MAG: PIN domain-containing protein [Bifidobacteriaceae bacterium]|jgi:toxin-antitoxin system PIN domain toxin|nr:PIN domain-containing protein [Bifidobacteriaceae bacterium]
MIMPDVNVLLPALHEGHPRHGQAAQWLEREMAGGAELGLSVLVLGGVMRIGTDKRVFSRPLSAQAAVELLARLLAAERVKLVSPGPRHWQILSQLIIQTGAVGAGLADAQHAAVAIEAGATWVTFDSDFGVFPGLDCVIPEL